MVIDRYSSQSETFLRNIYQIFYFVLLPINNNYRADVQACFAFYRMSGLLSLGSLGQRAQMIQLLFHLFNCL